jgi:hypothetical protein
MLRVSLYFTILRHVQMVRQMRDAPLDGTSQIMLRSETRLWVARLALVPTSETSPPGESNARHVLLRRVSYLSCLPYITLVPGSKSNNTLHLISHNTNHLTDAIGLAKSSNYYYININYYMDIKSGNAACLLVLAWLSDSCPP